MKIAFVILHYENLADTCNCIKSIRELKTAENVKTEIVVLDNNSPNGSGLELKKKYVGEKGIKTILLEKNMGFSRANNVGYAEAKKDGADVIIMSNNDIVIEDRDFVKRIKKYLTKENELAIIAPDITNANNQHQNPLKFEPMTAKKVFSARKRNKI